MSRLSIEVTPEQHQRLKAMAALQGKSMRAFVIPAIRSNNGAQKKPGNMPIFAPLTCSKAESISAPSHNSSATKSSKPRASTPRSASRSSKPSTPKPTPPRLGQGSKKQTRKAMSRRYLNAMEFIITLDRDEDGVWVSRNAPPSPDASAKAKAVRRPKKTSGKRSSPALKCGLNVACP